MDLNVAFDTGSSTQTVEKMIWDEVSDKGKLYTGKLRNGGVIGATGDRLDVTYVKVEIGYFRDMERKSQMGQWREIEVNFSQRPFEHNLSGSEIYRDFSFILPQGNSALIMGTSKLGVIWKYLTSSRDIKEVALIQEWAAAQVAQGGAPGSQGRAT